MTHNNLPRDESASSPSDNVFDKSKPAASRLIFLLLGVLIGCLGLLLIRFATYNPEHTHYHANFGVYINGARQQFKGAQYYQEVKVCDLAGTSPQARTHMHDNVSSVVHVHDDAVTWGQFFENLGWVVGPDFIRVSDRLYNVDGESKLNIVLNGDDLTDLTTITNQVIGNKDRLLLSYGPADRPILQQQYASVAADAAGYNEKQDPAACGGDDTPDFSERLKHLF